MMAYLTRHYKGFLLSYYEGSHWAITKRVPGKFFDKEEYIAFLGSEKACTEYIDKLKEK